MLSKPIGGGPVSSDTKKGGDAAYNIDLFSGEEEVKQDTAMQDETNQKKAKQSESENAGSNSSSSNSHSGSPSSDEEDDSEMQDDDGVAR